MWIIKFLRLLESFIHLQLSVSDKNSNDKQRINNNFLIMMHCRLHLERARWPTDE